MAKSHRTCSQVLAQIRQTQQRRATQRTITRALTRVITVIAAGLLILAATQTTENPTPTTYHSR